jgi:hypothetical protein
MSELAFNVNGEPFEVPPSMAGWRVRKLKPKGAPEVVYGRDGLPLFLPLDADIEDLRREARGDGRYRLDPVDDHNRTVPNAQAAYVCVHPVERAPEKPSTSAIPFQLEATAELVNALVESQRQHTEMARIYVSQFPVIVNALSGVVRSAGDAGLPGRAPFVVPAMPDTTPAGPEGGASGPTLQDGDDSKERDDEDESDDHGDDETLESFEDAPERPSQWVHFGNKVMEKFSPQLEALLGGLAGAAAHWGGRPSRRAAGAAETASRPETAPRPEAAAAVDPMAHLAAIRAAMRPEEANLAMQIAEELPLTEKLAYVRQLAQLPVPEAVAFLRSQLAALQGNRSAAEPSAELSDAELDAHFRAVLAALDAEDRETAQLLAEELPLALRRDYLRKLADMTLPEAVAYVRAELAKLSRQHAPSGRSDPPAIVPMADAAPATVATSVTPSAISTRRNAPRAVTAPDLGRRDRQGFAGALPSARRGSRVALAVAPRSSEPAPETGASLGLISPAVQTHIAAIQNALTREEDTAIRASIARMSAADQSTWVGRLLRLPVGEAVAMIRGELAAAAEARSGLPSTALRASDAGEVDDAPEVVGILDPAASAVAAESEPRHLATASYEAAGRDDHSTSGAPVLVTSGPELLPDGSPLATASDEAGGRAAPIAAGSTSNAAPVPVDKHAHLMAIELALTPEERFHIHAMIAQDSPEERRLWLKELLSLSVHDGATILRDMVRELAELEPVVVDLPDGTRTPGQEPDDRDDASLEDDEFGGSDPDDLDLADEDPELPETLERPPGDGAPRLGRGSAAPLAPRTHVLPPSGARDMAPTRASLPTLDAAALAHFDAIQRALTITERLQIHALGAQRSPGEVRAWLVELAQLPVAEAVARLRAALAAADEGSHTALDGDRS